MQDGTQENVVDIVELWRIVRSAERQQVPPERLPLVERALKILARSVDPQMVVNHKEDLTVIYPHLVHLALDSEPSVVELPPANFKTEDPLA